MHQIFKFKCRCLLHIYNGVSTHVMNRILLIDAEDIETATENVREKIEKEYRARSDCSLSSVLVELVQKVS